MPNRNQPPPGPPLQLRPIQSLTRTGKLKIIRRMLATYPSWPWAEASFREVEELDADSEIVLRYRHNRRLKLPSGMIDCPICGRTVPPNSHEYFFPGEGLLGGDVNNLEGDQRRPIGVWACADHKCASIQRAYGRSPSGMSIQAWKGTESSDGRQELAARNTQDMRGLSTDPPRRLPRESTTALQREIDYTNHKKGRISRNAAWDGDTGKVPNFKGKKRCKRPDNGA